MFKVSRIAQGAIVKRKAVALGDEENQFEWVDMRTAAGLECDAIQQIRVARMLRKNRIADAIKMNGGL